MKKRPGPSLLATLLLIVFSSGRAQTPTPSAVSDLGGTSWQLVKFQGSDDKTLTPADERKYTLAFTGDGVVSLRVDCNRGHGTWKSPGANQLQFGSLAVTLAMCPPAPFNDRIPKDWEYVRSYVLKDGHLFLSLMADRGTYEFEPLRPEQQKAGQIRGTATYSERMALPPKAVFEATLEDVSKADSRGQVLLQVRIENPGNPPIPFQIPYDPSHIDASHRYAVQAQILVDGKVFFTTDQHYPVLTAGHGSQVSLLLRRAVRSAVAEGKAEATSNQ